MNVSEKISNICALQVTISLVVFLRESCEMHLWQGLKRMPSAFSLDMKYSSSAHLQTRLKTQLEEVSISCYTPHSRAEPMLLHSNLRTQTCFEGHPSQVQKHLNSVGDAGLMTKQASSLVREHSKWICPSLGDNSAEESLFLENRKQG